MTTTEDERHRYGQHYTPDVVARLLAAFAIRSASDLVFDPSCGDGRLLAAARSAKMAHALAAENNGRGQPLCRSKPAQHSLKLDDSSGLFGIDRSGEAVSRAGRTGAQVAVADFFDIVPGGKISGTTTLPDRFDAIIGNPPYIRQELLGDYKSRINGVLARTPTSEILGGTRRPDRRSSNGRPNDSVGCPDSQLEVPRWSRRSDIYVYFFAHAATFLKPGGRLVFLTASSWLDVGYGAQLQEFMLRNFKILLVLESAVESFFADASVNTSITVLERELDAGQRLENTVRFIQMLKPLGDIMPASPLDATKLARRMEQGSAGRKIGAVRIRTAGQQELLGSPRRRNGLERSRPGPAAKERQSTWGRFLRAEDVFFRVLDTGRERFARLADLASVRFGVKTGANDFFYVRPELTGGGPLAGKSASLMKPLESLARVRRGITTGANEFFYLKPPPGSENGGGDFPVVTVQNAAGEIIHLESKYLRPVVFSLKEIPSIEIKDARTKMLFFDCPDSKAKLRGTLATEYIQAGERAGIHLRPTCSARIPWYGVARGWEPAPLIFPSKVGERWLVAINRAGVYEDKKLYGIFPGPRVSLALLAALLNSTWARYYAEMTCRQLTGAQAIADIDVAVAERIQLPDPEAIQASGRRQLGAAIGALARRPVLSIFEEVRREDRRVLDELVLTAIGFKDDKVRREVLSELYRASTELVRLRLARAGKPVRVDKCGAPALESAAGKASNE